MKNKIFGLALACMLAMPAVFAETAQLKVTAINEFRTDAPAQTVSVRVREDVRMGKYYLKEGDVLNCKVLYVTDPKRGKQNASFYVEPLTCVSEGKMYNIDEEYCGKYSKTVLSLEEIKKIPPGTAIKKTALTVGSHFVKGLSMGVYFAQGVIQNKDDGRIKSGVKNAYKESPLSYVEKGQELDLKTGDEFYLVFKISENDEPNYTYTE
jgi:hypothetical protein